MKRCRRTCRWDSVYSFSSLSSFPSLGQPSQPQPSRPLQKFPCLSIVIQNCFMQRNWLYYTPPKIGPFNESVMVARYSLLFRTQSYA